LYRRRKGRLNGRWEAVPQRYVEVDEGSAAGEMAGGSGKKNV
jgi:hypothetical protein